MGLGQQQILVGLAALPTYGVQYVPNSYDTSRAMRLPVHVMDDGVCWQRRHYIHNLESSSRYAGGGYYFMSESGYMSQTLLFTNYVIKTAVTIATCKSELGTVYILLHEVQLLHSFWGFCSLQYDSSS